MDEEDPRIEELLRSGRRRNAIALAILGVIAIVGGAIVLAMLLTQDVNLAGSGRRPGVGYSFVFYSASAIVIGIILLGMAVKTLFE